MINYFILSTSSKINEKIVCRFKKKYLTFLLFLLSKVQEIVGNQIQHYVTD